MAKPALVRSNKVAQVQIDPARMIILKLDIVGNAPYVQHRFSEKALLEMMATQSEGRPAGNKRKREPKDFKALYLGALHKSSKGWHGIPAPCFRNAAISACKVVGYHMTKAKLAIFIEADGWDAKDGTPLVRIYGAPRMHTGPARNDNGSIDIRSRPMWMPGWKATVRVKFDSGMFTTSDVYNLVQRAGLQVGIGEGRPDSKNSAGCGWGTFDISQDKPAAIRRGK